jgi:GntR family transcriptional repressor for pyruvate dehydrogenase complex
LAYLFKNIASHLEHTGYSEHDLICARAVIESAAVRIAAHRRKAKDLLKILSTIEDMEQSHAKGTPDETNDMEFHLALLKATQNPVLEVFGTLIVNVFFPKIRAGFMAPEQTRLLTLSEHRSIYQAVHDQDAEAASKAIYDHITAPLRGRKIREDGS